MKVETRVRQAIGKLFNGCLYFFQNERKLQRGLPKFQAHGMLAPFKIQLKSNNFETTLRYKIEFTHQTNLEISF